jgi:curved DNA-binding protein CbpA
MSSNKRFDPDKIIDYNLDYYAILGIEKGCLPAGGNKKEREEISKILEMAFRKSAMKSHPDVPGGSEEKFKMVVRAQTILLDPILRRIYESGGKDRPQFIGDDNQFEVNWDTVGTYREGTQDDTVGFSLFLKLSERAKSLGLVPSFYPSLPEHNYEWDWTLPVEGVKFSLSLVRDEGEVLRLTSKESVEAGSLPFKIYFCIPRAALRFLRGKKEEHLQADGTVDTLKGLLKGAQYSDFNFLETTTLEEAYEYISEGGKLETHLAAYRDGSMIEAQQKLDREAQQLKWADTTKVKNLDSEMIKAILTAKSLKFTPAPEGADNFIDDIPDD